MPPVPPSCQLLANQVDELVAEELATRTLLPTLAGEAAWRTLVVLSNIRRALEKKKQELEICISNNSAALNANLIVMEIDAQAGAESSRVAHLWEVTPEARIVRETTQVNSNSFVFKGPLPASFGISIAAMGLPDVTGPDFCATIPAGTPVTPMRAEVLIGPEITIGFGELLTRLASTNLTAHRFDVPWPPTSVEFTVTSTSAEIVANVIVGRLSGEIRVQSAGVLNQPGLVQQGLFMGQITVTVVPLGEPGSNISFDLISSPVVTIDMPGLFGSLVDAMTPLLNDLLRNELVARVRTAIRELIDAEIRRALVISIPADVTISIRRIMIDAKGLTFQPTLSAVGDTLSRFTVAALPPP